MTDGADIGAAELVRWLSRIEARLEELGRTLVVRAVYEVEQTAVKAEVVAVKADLNRELAGIREDHENLRKHLTWLVYTIGGALIASVVGLAVRTIGV